jgi:hypothetical protein
MHGNVKVDSSRRKEGDRIRIVLRAVGALAGPDVGIVHATSGDLDQHLIGHQYLIGDRRRYAEVATVD